MKINSFKFSLSLGILGARLLQTRAQHAFLPQHAEKISGSHLPCDLPLDGAKKISPSAQERSHDTLLIVAITGIHHARKARGFYRLRIDTTFSEGSSSESPIP